MKKIIAAIIFATFISTTLSAGAWSWITSTGSDTLPSKLEQLETNGQNPRVYEFHKTFEASGETFECIAIAKDNGLAVWCNPKPIKKKGDKKKK